MRTNPRATTAGRPRLRVRARALALVAGLLIPAAAGVTTLTVTHAGPQHSAVTADLGWDAGTAPTPTPTPTP